MYLHLTCRCPCVTQFCAGWYQSPHPCTDATHPPIMGAHTKRFVLLFQSLQLADFVDNQCQYQQSIINAKSWGASHPHATHPLRYASSPVSTRGTTYPSRGRNRAREDRWIFHKLFIPLRWLQRRSHSKPFTHGNCPLHPHTLPRHRAQVHPC